MLSKEEIEKRIRRLIELEEEFMLFMLILMAERIYEIGELDPQELYSLPVVMRTSSDIQQINKTLERVAKTQIKATEDIIEAVAQDTYADMKPLYERQNVRYQKLSDNEKVQMVIDQITQQTVGNQANLSGSKAFMIRDPSNRQILKPTSMSETYQSVIDEAIQNVRNSAIDYQTAMRKTTTQLIESGVRRAWWDTESGRPYTQSIEVATRRNILDGIRAVNQGVLDETGKQFGADGKEISVHANSAPDHEPIQGHQFTNEEYEKLQTQQDFQDLSGNVFPAIERPIGWYNCYHISFPIIVGFTKPTFTQEQLDEYIRKNQEGYTLPNGKHLTMYDCTQYQRRLEREIRKAKMGQVTARTAGDNELAKSYQAKVNRKQNEYAQFSKACGLSQKRDRISIPDYHKIKI